eukprot:869116-Rhodomonas_salina.1
MPGTQKKKMAPIASKVWVASFAKLDHVVSMQFGPGIAIACQWVTTGQAGSESSYREFEVALRGAPESESWCSGRVVLARSEDFCAGLRGFYSR